MSSTACCASRPGSKAMARPLRRVVITGIGLVTPVGDTPAGFFENLITGRSGVRRLESGFADALETPLAATVDFDPAPYFTRMQLAGVDRASQFAVACAIKAMADAGLDAEGTERQRFGVSIGTGMGGANALESAYTTLLKEGQSRLPPLTLVASIHNAPAAQISLRLGLRGPSYTYSVACASAAIAIGEAMRSIRHGYADMMLAGGTDALLTYGVFKTWEAMRTLATPTEDGPATACRPFSADRSGLVLGEGSAMFLLETLESARARGARIYGELSGFGSASDASNMVKPDADGQYAAMRGALDDAGLQPEDIGYINAHGTATRVGDVTETKAIKRVFGDSAIRLPVSSTKALHGHLMGATGAIEMAAAVLALKYRTAPPTCHLHAPDPECDLDYVAEGPRPLPMLAHVMSNSFAFGGSNAVLIASRVN